MRRLFGKKSKSEENFSSKSRVRREIREEDPETELDVVEPAQPEQPEQPQPEEPSDEETEAGGSEKQTQTVTINIQSSNPYQPLYPQLPTDPTPSTSTITVGNALEQGVDQTEDESDDEEDIKIRRVTRIKIERLVMSVVIFITL